MFICLDKSIGSVVTSNVPIHDQRYVPCDGRRIQRADYPELLEALREKGDSYRMPDYSRILSGVGFYMIARY